MWNDIFGAIDSAILTCSMPSAARRHPARRAKICFYRVFANGSNSRACRTRVTLSCQLATLTTVTRRERNAAIDATLAWTATRTASGCWPRPTSPNDHPRTIRSTEVRISIPLACISDLHNPITPVAKVTTNTSAEGPVPPLAIPPYPVAVM